MAKVVLDPIGSGYNRSKIEANFQKIEDELNDKVLYRDNPVGEPNQWETQQDANSNRLINLPDAVSQSEPITLRQLQSGGIGLDAPVDAVGVSYRTTTVENGLSKKPWEFDTEAEMAAADYLEAGDVVIIKERANSRWDVIAATTNNGYDTLDGTASAVSVRLSSENSIYFSALGANEDGSDETAIASYAASLGKEIIVQGNVGLTGQITTAVSGTKFIGLLSPKISKFTILSGTVNNVFAVTDASNVEFICIGFYGNGNGAGAGVAGAIKFECSSSATEDMVNTKVHKCYFENWRQNYWVLHRNNSDTYKLRDCEVSNCEFISKTGNDVDPTSIGVPATCVSFIGNINDQDGEIRQIKITNNYADCTHMKRFLDVWGQTHGGEISNNRIYNCGANANNDTGCYAIMCYTHRYLTYPGSVIYKMDPSELDINNNYIISPRDCGLYMQGLNNSNVFANKITGQYGTVNTTLSKGAIVTNGVDNVNIYDNILWDNAFDMGLAQINYKSAGIEISCHIHNNQCMSNASSSTVRIVGNSDAGVDGSNGEMSVLNFFDNKVKGTVEWVVTNVTNHFKLNISGGEISDSQLIGYYTRIASIPTPSGLLELNIRDVNFYEHPQNAINHVSIDYINTLIDGCKFDLGTILAQCINISSSKFVTWTRNHFWASVTPAAGDYCVNLTSAEHLSWGNTMEGIDAANKQVGFAAPAWAAHEGEYVQTLRASEAGAASSKYILRGYIYAENIAAWVEDRVLTGN